MKLTLYLSLFCLFVVSCDNKVEPIENPVDVQVISDSPPSFMQKWVGDNGVLAAFGANSEIGALLRYNYDWESDVKIAIFDKSGKKFLNVVNGFFTGPHDVADLFDLTNLFDLKDNYTGGLFLDTISIYGVEAAAIDEDGDEDVLVIITKDGTHRNLYVSSSQTEIKSKEYGSTAKSTFNNGVEAMMNKSLLILIDETGSNLENANGTSMGTVSANYPEIPSSKIEAICNFNQEGKPVTFCILGADGNISNGRYAYVITKDSTGLDETLLVDLLKNID